METFAIGTGADAETVEIANIRLFGTPAITFSASLAQPHASGETVAGSGITFTTSLKQHHPAGAQITINLPTPGAPNRYLKGSN